MSRRFCLVDDAMPRLSTTTADVLPGSDLVLPGDRSAEVHEFEAAVVGFFVDAADLLGVPKSVAAIYGIIFASPQPISFADIEARLDISKGSISQGLRVLREIGALKEVSADADRAELFTPDLEMRKLVARFLENRLKRQLDAGSTRLATLQRALPASRSADTEVLRERLHSLQAWHSKARALLPVAKTFLKLGG
jgi:DNA-binding transcriptional regulator GbsR (MarR family)